MCGQRVDQRGERIEAKEEAHRPAHSEVVSRARRAAKLSSDEKKCEEEKKEDLRRPPQVHDSDPAKHGSDGHPLSCRIATHREPDCRDPGLRAGHEQPGFHGCSIAGDCQ